MFDLIRAVRRVRRVTSVSWHLVQGRRRQGLSGWWVWHHPWLQGSGRWRRGSGLSWPGCAAGWRAERDAGGDRPHWMSVFCVLLPPLAAGSRNDHSVNKMVEYQLLENYIESMHLHALMSLRETRLFRYLGTFTCTEVTWLLIIRGCSTCSRTTSLF